MQEVLRPEKEVRNTMEFLQELQVPAMTGDGLLCKGKMREALEGWSRKPGELRYNTRCIAWRRRAICSSHGHA